MLISGKIAKLFKFPGFVCIDYLIEHKIYVSPSIILNALTRDWRRWRRPAGFDNKTKTVYPVTVDPTFGYKTVGATTTFWTGGDDLSGCLFSCPEFGTANSISIYCNNNGVSGNAKMAIYKGSDKSLVGYTEEFTLQAEASWHTADIISGGGLSEEDYYLCVWESNEIKIWMDIGETDQRAKQTIPYNDFPQTFEPTDFANQKYSIYCTYTTVPPPPARAKLADLTKVVAPWSGATTAAGNTVVKTPATGKKVRIKDIFIWNASGEDRWVGLRFGWTGELIFPTLLSDKSSFGKNVIGGNLEGNVNETLYLYSSGNLVYFSVLGEEV